MSILIRIIAYPNAVFWPLGQAGAVAGGRGAGERSRISPLVSVAATNHQRRAAILDYFADEPAIAAVRRQERRAEDALRGADDDPLVGEDPATQGAGHEMPASIAEGGPGQVYHIARAGDDRLKLDSPLGAAVQHRALC